MTTAALEIQRLDRFLRLYGSGTGQLVRIIGTTSQTTYSVDVRAHIRSYRADELNEHIIQGDSRVIISSSEIAAAVWPGAAVPDDSSIPRRGDKFIWQTRSRNVQSCEPLYLDDILVRIVIQVRGQQ